MEAPQTLTAALPYTITVKVLRANRLQGRKPSCQSFVKVEVDGTVLGESEKTLKDASENVFHYDFSCSFQCSREPQAVAALARKLVIVTVSDFLPDERKADARTAVLGQAVLDLLPFLHGQTKFSSRVPIHSGADVQTKGRDRKTPILQSSQDAGASDELVRKAVLKWRKPTLDVRLDASEALMSSVDLACSNLLRVTVETAFSVPEPWTQPAGSSPTSASYTAALELPVSTQNNQMLVFSDGALKAGGSREEKGRPKKRPFLPQLLPANTALPGASVEPTPIEQEDGELTGRGDRLFREEAETKKGRVSWDVEMSCFLSGEATNRLRDTITKCRLWPVEIMRSAANAKMLPEENPDIPFHGVAFVDMGRLLFPGATRIRGAYCVQPFTENLLSDKAKRSVSVLKEHAKAVAATAQGASAAVTGKKGTGNKGAARKPAQSRVEEADGATDITAETVNSQGNLYLDARTYILVEISLEKPLVPKTPPEELSRRVMALIPPKPPATPGPTKAEQAVQSFHEQVSNAVRIVSEQVAELYGADGKLSEVSKEDLKAQVMAELNLSGRYFSFREPLKHAVERLARDKMPGSDLINDASDKEEFVCNMYTYLVDEMHVGLNKILSDEEEDTSEEFHLSPSQVRHFTKEAQSIGDYELALQHCLEVLVQNPKDPQSMFDLGSHYMLTEDYMKARACFYEALAIDPIHQPSLILCGVLAFLFENYTDAQTFLEQAATMDNHGVVAWTILGLLHESQEDEILSERAFLEANKMLKSEESSKLKEVLKHWSELVAEKTAEEPQEAVTQAASPPPPEEQDQAERRRPSVVGSTQGPESEEEDPESSHEAKSSEPTQRPSIYTETVSFLLQNNALQMAERALAQELLSPEGGYTVSYLLHLARLQLRRGEYASAVANLEEALHHNDENAEAWALKGHCHLLQGALCRARESYECSLSFQPPPADPHLVLLRLGSICQEAGQFEQAKERHLQACEQSPSCLTWLGLGVACYRLGEMSLAESALTEANRLNSCNARVWIYLSFICLKSNRLKEAELFHKYAVKFKLQDEELLREFREMHEVASFSHLSHLFEDRTGAGQV